MNSARIGERLRRQFDSRPDAEAVIEAGCRWSYADLELTVADLTRRICSADPRGTVVAVALARSALGVAAMLATWRSGRTYVALDPMQPPERTSLILQAVGATLIVVPDGAMQDSWPGVIGLAARGHFTLTPQDALQLSDPAQLPSSEPELAYIVFTSGSTGQPKGVLMPITAINGLVQWHLDSDCKPGRRTALFAAVGFDVAVQEVLATLSEGGTLVVVDDSTRRDPIALKRLLRSETVQRLFLPTAALQLIAEEWTTTGAPECLETVICAGEQLQLGAAVRALFRLLPRARLHNHYGPAETHVVTAHQLDPDPDQWPELAPIGLPLPQVTTTVHPIDGDPHIGELEIAGPRVSAGYLGDDTRFGLTLDGLRRYRTGDLVRKQGDSLVYVGRRDRQVKVSGYRVEPGATETALLKHPDITGCAVEPIPSEFGTALIGYLTVRPGAATASDPHRTLGHYLKSTLPAYQIPTRWQVVEELPLTVNGKLDRAALTALTTIPTATSLVNDPLDGPISATLAVEHVYSEVLGRTDFDHSTNFFDLGGTSILAAELRTSLARRLRRPVPIAMIYDHPSARLLAEALSSDEQTQVTAHLQTRTSNARINSRSQPDDIPIAVIGMACRFPESPSPESLWDNLIANRDCIRREHAPDGTLLRAGGVVGHLEFFDTDLFPISAREATLLDPQHRMFLETCWSAMESAGLPPRQTAQTVGLYGGVGPSSYLINNVLPTAARRHDRTFLDSSSDLQLLLATDKDYLTSRVAYLLDLRGPVFTVQAACATGLVAVHLAVQALRNGDCDVALAGAANASVPQMGSYLGEPGMVLAPDAVTRSYDSRANGTVFSSGAGVVVLKPLVDAEAAGDPILAVISGSAVGNDGASKVAMSAPSTRGQASVIRQALQVAGLGPDELDFVEGHGTATQVGDPIEIQALNSVLTARQGGPVWLGSIKSQIGHTGTASGLAGLIKTVLCLQHRTITATSHFERPNPEAPFEAGPLRVVTENQPLPSRGPGIPRRAGVSAFGLGGVNAHLVVNEYLNAPITRPIIASPRQRTVELAPVSAASEAACIATLAALAAADTAPAANVARTLAVGRAHLRWRTSIVVRDGETSSVLRNLGEQIALGTRRPVAAESGGRLAMMFTGHHPNGLDLRQLDLPVIRAVIEASDPVMSRAVGVSASDVLLGGQSHHDPLLVGQAAQFVLQAALVEQWREWGVTPDLVIGHSLGEFAAAFAAGVITLDAGIRLAAARGRLLHDLPEDGAMAVIGADPGAILAIAGDDIDLAAINGPDNVVVSGPGESIDALCEHFSASGHRVKPLPFGRAGHSRAIEASLPTFRATLAAEHLMPPRVEFISNLTGRRVGVEITNPDYWIRQLRETVQFSAGMAEAASTAVAAWLEVGPAPILGSVVASRLGEGATILPSMRLGQVPEETMLKTLGVLWEQGIDIAWDVVTDTSAARISLPGVCFDRRRYWIDPPAANDPSIVMPPVSAVRWVPDTRPVPRLLRGHWLILGASDSTGRSLAEALRAAGHLCTRPEDWPTLDEADIATTRSKLAGYLRAATVPLSGVLWLDPLQLSDLAETDPTQALSTIGSRTLAVLQQLCDTDGAPLRTMLVTRGLIDAATGEQLAQACIAGIARSVTREYPELTCVRVDLPQTHTDDVAIAAITAALARFDEADVAYRNGQLLNRRVLAAEPTSGRHDRHATHVRSREPASSLDADGCYLVTGGTGGLGVLTAAVLLRRGAGRVVLCGRTTPMPTDWRTLCLELSEQVGVDVASRVVFTAADLSDREDVERLVHELDAPTRPLRGVIHAAAELADAALHNQDHETFARAANAKALGAWHLHHALRDHPGLHMFTSYTSATGVLGNAGQANYAAACTFVDALMDARARLGIPGQSIAWGPWLGAGHLRADTQTLEKLNRSGMGAIRREAGIQVMSELIGNDTGSIAVLPNDWSRWRIGTNPAETAALVDVPTTLSTVPAAAMPSMTGADGQTPGAITATPVPDLSSIVVERLIAGDRDSATTELTAAVIDAAAAVLGARPEADTDLAEAGLDSLSAVQLRNAITRLVGEQLPVTACLELRTCARLADAALDRIVAASKSVVEVDA